MKALSEVEALAWLASAGRSCANLDYKLMSFLRPGLSSAIMAIPQDVRSLAYLAGSLGNWFEPSTERLLWLDDGGAGPDWDYWTSMNRLRSPDRSTTFLSAPAQLFDAGKAFDFYGPPAEMADTEENTILTALIFQMMCFDCHGYLIPRVTDEFIKFDDETIVLGNLRPERRDAAKLLAGPSIQVRWAYSIDDFRPYVFQAGRVED